MGVGVAGVGGGGGLIAAPSEFIGGIPHFEDDTLEQDFAPVGIANSKLAILSFWFKLTGNDNSDMAFMEMADVPSVEAPFSIKRLSSNRWEVAFREDGAATVWVARGQDNTFSTVHNPGWHHFLVALNAGTGVRHIYIDDVIQTLETDTLNNLFVGYTTVTRSRLGTIVLGGISKLHSDIAQLYINTDEFLDMTVEANRRKFIAESGCAVSLGSDGSDPTGNAPTYFFDNPVSTWQNNLGTGGNFTVTSGSLTDASGSPCWAAA